MELFFSGWILIQQFLYADAYLPKESALPRPADRQVAKELEIRREFTVVEVLEALDPLVQPELLQTTADDAEVELTRGEKTEVEAVVAPVARNV